MLTNQVLKRFLGCAMCFLIGIIGVNSFQEKTIPQSLVVESNIKKLETQEPPIKHLDWLGIEDPKVSMHYYSGRLVIHSKNF